MSEAGGQAGHSTLMRLCSSGQGTCLICLSQGQELVRCHGLGKQGELHILSVNLGQTGVLEILSSMFKCGNVFQDCPGS